MTHDSSTLPNFMNPSATIKLFLPFGDPKNVRTAEISNWSGKAIAGPRSELDHLLARPELGKPGVYLLLGVDAQDGALIAYVGEAEMVADRVKQHRSKDYWNSAVVFVSKDENLTKAHVRYLEGRIIDLALSVGRYRVANANASGAHLPESDQQDMEVFLERVIQLLPVLGTELLMPIAPSARDVPVGSLLFCSMKGAQASGLRSSNGFVVLQGSTAVLTERDSARTQGAWVLALRAKLVAEGALVVQGGYLSFAKDVEFASPSAAAAVVHGGNAAGPIAWKDVNGTTLKELEGGG